MVCFHGSVWLFSQSVCYSAIWPGVLLPNRGILCISTSLRLSLPSPLPSSAFSLSKWGKKNYTLALLCPCGWLNQDTHWILYKITTPPLCLSGELPLNYTQCLVLFLAVTPVCFSAVFFSTTKTLFGKRAASLNQSKVTDWELFWEIGLLVIYNKIIYVSPTDYSVII